MIQSMASSSPRRAASARRAIACLFLMLLGTASSRAEILIEGSRAALRLEVTEASVGDILAALGSDYNVRYRASVALDRQITGSYAGPIASVIARVLEGYDYAARISPDAIEIAFIRARGGAEPAAAPARPPAPVLRTSIGRLQK